MVNREEGGGFLVSGCEVEKILFNRSKRRERRIFLINSVFSVASCEDVTSGGTRGRKVSGVGFQLKGRWNNGILESWRRRCFEIEGG
jgi:hypothetical protein